MKAAPGVFLLVLLFLLPIFSLSSDEKNTFLEADRDNDGQTDYLMEIDEMGKKVYEEIDFNHDGEMDDFYYYDKGVLQKREIDSNFDNEIDIWVFIHAGVYIERYERDLDFDGVIDQVKTFGGDAPLSQS
jgi:hypothetical protein